jgi:hypothetical protein
MGAFGDKAMDPIGRSEVCGVEPRPDRRRDPPHLGVEAFALRVNLWRGFSGR